MESKINKAFTITLDAVVYELLMKRAKENYRSKVGEINSILSEALQPKDK